jgi:putative transposase
MLSTYRRAYNLAVEFFTTFSVHKGLDENGEKIDLRNKIRKIVSEECLGSNKAYNSNVVNEAVKEANQKFIEVCKKNKKTTNNKEYSTLGFKSCKLKVQTWRIDRLPKSHMPCKDIIGSIYITEKINNCAEGQSVSVTLDHGRWYMNVVKHISLFAEKQGEVKCVSVDPGSRTFATCYSESEVVVAGKNFAIEYLVPLAKELRSLESKKRKLNKINFLEKDDEGKIIKPQWYYDRLTHIENRMNKTSQRKADLVLDLHQKTAFYLVSHYDVIFLPTFETKKMVKKGKRKLNKTAVKNMLSLNHYQFKLMIKWYAKKYGKHVVDVNESYTTKTHSWNGFIDEKIGSKKYFFVEINGNEVKIDRDVNAARGIFIRSLSLLQNEFYLNLKAT